MTNKIENEEQRSSTLELIERFYNAAEEARIADLPKNMHPLLQKAVVDSYTSQANDLRRQVEEYDLGNMSNAV